MTKKFKTTYSQLDNVLLTLGFTRCGVAENNKVFEHKETGALVIYPVFPPDEPVLPRHEHMVETILDVYGIAEPGDLTRELEKAS